ncbi:MAG TPA: helix-turn-helix domain-containing protein [Rhizomicrobium sp.]|nr:helix-turn-helix domain-containing protein [Rhizomicrobium sp.]
MPHAATSRTTSLSSATTLVARTGAIAALDEGRETLRVGAVSYAPAEREIFAEGDSADVFFRIVSGTVRTCKFLSDGRRQIEAFYTAGDVFGFELEDARMLSAEAVTDCNLIAYRRKGVEAAALHDETLARQLLTYAMRSVSHAQKHAFLLGRRAATEKVASFLLTWAVRHGRQGHIELPMSRQDMADYMGLTIETVSRTLSQMERDGLIAIPNARQIQFQDRQALEDLTI